MHKSMGVKRTENLKGAESQISHRNYIRDAAFGDYPNCDYCGALKGDPCRTPNWKTRKPHKGRLTRA